MTLNLHLLFYFTYDYPFALRDVSGCRFLSYTIIDRQDTNQVFATCQSLTAKLNVNIFRQIETSAECTEPWSLLQQSR